MRTLGKQRSARAAIVVACAWAAVAGTAKSQVPPEVSPGAAENWSAGELIFRLQYVGTDYGAAVADGRVLDADEYREIVDLSASVPAEYRNLRPRGSALPDLARLNDLIHGRADWAAVRTLSRELVARIGDELDVIPYPAQTPDLDRGRALYQEDCAPCHGATGNGDGPASPGMTPKPTSFRGPQIALISPHQVFNATSFGVAGTAMPSYRGALQPHDLWDMAFFVMTLRGGFDPTLPAEIVPLSLQELAAQSDEEILKRLRASRPGTAASDVDYYRAMYRGTPRHEVTDRAVVGESGIAVAESLERAFAQAAERVFPSVVGISIYERDGAPDRDQIGAPTGDGWKEGDTERRLYPGFRRTLSGTGFLVTGDGDVLTCADVLDHRGPVQNSRVIDVEMPDNIHCRARVVGIEPTIDLAVLRIVPPVPLRSVTIGDSDDVRVGHWAIAVGDPPGPEKIFAPGTIAARPERECYQEHRTSTLLQSSASMTRAGFGGPLVNIRGEVVGLTIPGPGAPVEPSEASTRPVSALPINLAMTIYRALKIKESEQSPWIGISVLELSAQLRRRLKSSPLTGIYIDDVFEPSPASRVGIRVGDILTKMDDHSILGVPDFQTWLYLSGIDAAVTLEIYRNGKTLRLGVTIEQRPESAVTR